MLSIFPALLDYTRFGKRLDAFGPQTTSAGGIEIMTLIGTRLSGKFFDVVVAFLSSWMRAVSELVDSEVKTRIAVAT